MNAISIDHVLQAAREAGQEILRFYGGALEVESKKDDSPLTQADLASHRYLVDRLRKIDHRIPVLSEESGEEEIAERHQWETFWLIDPLDGTKEFIKGTGYFTVNIALIQSGVPVLGVVHAPVHELTYWAEAGGPARKKVGAGDVETIQARIPVETPLRIVASRDHAGPMVESLCQAFPGASRVSIGSSLKFCLVAEGAADIYLRDVPTMEWDTAAAQCVVEAAGAKLCDLQGDRLVYNKSSLRNPSLVTFADPGLNWAESLGQG